MIPPNVPIIDLQDMFWNYDEESEIPYTLNILLESSQSDLNQIVNKRNKKPLSFKDFFPIFRDTILGLTFMHINNIAHRDINPNYIINVKKGIYALADYGQGVNLNFQETYSENDFFQVGNWHLDGTYEYLDPAFER